MKFLRMLPLCLLLAVLPGCDYWGQLFAPGSPNAIKFQDAMVAACNFRPKLETAIAIVKAFDADIGKGIDFINGLADRACASVMAKKGAPEDWTIVAPNGEVVKIEGEFVTPDAPAPQ